MPIRTLRRYTSLPILISALQRRALTLVSPRGWKDRNDAHFLATYKRKGKFKSVLALCFAEAQEASHHWEVFAPGMSGVCLCFRPTTLLEAVRKDGAVFGRKVHYRTIRSAGERTLKVADLPFLKRRPYRAEREFRLIYASATAKVATYDLAFPLSAIERIYLSPELPEPLVDEVKRTLKGIRGCGGLRIYRSTLSSNAQWKELGDGAR
jgi:hypothetical protein